jgi:hypothetical protein
MHQRGGRKINQLTVVLMSSEPGSAPLHAIRVKSPWLYVDELDELVDTRKSAGRRPRLNVLSPPLIAPADSDGANSLTSNFSWVLEPEFDMLPGDDVEML